jgi:predicted AAA+ superfamily ATPase
MAKSNRDRISEVMDALKEGLGTFVLREYNAIYGAKRFLEVIEQTLTTGAYSSGRLPDVKTALEKIDVQGLLNLMIRQWNEVFKAKLGKVERSFVGELLEARNDWAHQKAFTNDDAHRVADTATRLLEAIGAPKQALVTRATAQELLRLRFDAEAKQTAKTPSPDEVIRTTLPGLRPWRVVVQPHPDVASGRYILADFVANIADVKANSAATEYGDPKEFFRRTYLTEGLLSLLVTSVRRLSGQGGDPVVQLQTSFGGGKTHSLLALYHLFSGEIGISDIPGGEHILAEVGEVDDKIAANRVVIVGTAFSPTEPRVYADATTNTLWGDIAYQLGGAEAYQLVERADLTGVAPGSDTLVQLLEKYGPALIMIDELVAFARNLPVTTTDRIPAGTFDSTMTFFQSLTEAVKRSSDSMLLVSIPESENEIGGELGKQALDILAKTIGRVESVWKPVTATESFEIVRRRLFTSDIDYAARDAVVNAFGDLYRNNKGEFPSGVAESEYATRMKSAYPIHPELFDRLYQDWSTLDRFQRTRGVLRLMATVIHKLWQDNDQSLLIMPASIPLWASSVRNEMLRYLPENWPAIVDADIDGDDAKPFQLDKSVPTIGQYMASRRIARSIFIGSAPSVMGQAVRGVEEVRIRLATVQPGEPLPVFNDALRRMSQQLTYLYTDGSRYWYDTRPTVNRIAQDRAQNLNADLVYQEAIDRLRKVKYRREDFAAAHVAPANTSDIADEPRARVVVLQPEYVHKKSNGVSDAVVKAREILENRGTSPRLYRNMLVFIVADANDAEAWEKALREYLAWKSISDEEEQLNLDSQQRKQVKSNLDRTDETVRVRLQETYSWLLVPVQPDPTGEIEFQAQRVPGQESFYDRASRKLRQSGMLIPEWSPDTLLLEIEQYNLWRDDSHVEIKQLWDYLARYCYLPRLFDQQVLLNAVRDGISREDAPFGYATLVGSDGSYKGLVFRQPVASIYFDDNVVLVHAESAENQQETERIKREQETTTKSLGTVSSTKGGTGRLPPVPQSEPSKPRVMSRYHGTVSLDSQRVNREMATIVEEIIQRLTSLTGTDVEITVEISAERPNGFDDGTIRTVSENSRTLKFKDHGFEGD